MNNRATVLRWNPKQVGMLLVGHLDGSWIMWDDNDRKQWCKPQYATGEAAKVPRQEPPHEPPLEPPPSRHRASRSQNC